MTKLPTVIDNTAHTVAIADIETNHRDRATSVSHEFLTDAVTLMDALGADGRLNVYVLEDYAVDGVPSLAFVAIKADVPPVVIAPMVPHGGMQP